MRASVESCLFASLLAAQSLALPTRLLAAPPPVHGEAAEGGRDGAAAAADTDWSEVVLQMGLVASLLANFLSAWTREGLRKENADLRAFARQRELKHRKEVEDLRRENADRRRENADPKARGGEDPPPRLTSAAEKACSPPKS